ncbi:hypothetical protein AWM68_20900 [Fictibacillus phosphorivorans]|uniref:Uncharacterized protein n=1 Tax=Fictibacillus phosphorivorans TaxID=1221500 RepID=A0A163QDS1_9BACL|nr:hypothetical protein [Fictibacillus phosphorivorans]KZE64973.1 hypothetical protein AWM68_20900 [Fictibacillus phosphorivorans]
MLVQNKGNYILHAAGVMLIPGANKISEAEWKDFSSHPIMKKVVDDGDVVAHEEEKDFKDLKAKEAIELVKDTHDVALLNEWQEGESRTTVLEAIDAQLAVLNGENEDE